MKNLLLPLTLLLLFSTCSQQKQSANTSYKLNQPLVKLAIYDEGYPIVKEQTDPDAPYKSEEYLQYYHDYYKEKSTPPPFDFSADFSKKSFQELRELRAEVLARHGYLFMDYVLRSRFNATKWYQPVFWYNDFKIHLTDQEQQFIDKVLRLEKEKYKQNYIISNGYKKANMENVVNWQQFESVPDQMMQHLTRDGFVINKAQYHQLFHVYDENYYDYTPSFITTDLYLQVLHMHISKEMQALEEEKMIPLLKELLNEQYLAAKKLTEAHSDNMIKNAAGWNQVYYAVALSLLTNEKKNVPSHYQEAYAYEYEHTKEGQGKKSDFLGDSLIDYTQFQPRGNYTRTDALKNYFRCVKWLNTAGVFLDEDESLSRAILMGISLQRSASLKNYHTFSNITSFLAGDENNLSFNHLLSILSRYKNNTEKEILSKETMATIRTELYSADPKRMFAAGANDRTQYFLARKKILFTAGRYTFDGEILQRLVHISRPEIKRPFPKGLDVFAATGNKTAESILLNEYKENQAWSNYSDTLERLKKKFASFNEWNKSIYNKQMETVLSLQQTSSNHPYFMQMPDWQKKNLNTMLASWTELKHDMILYIEQPSGAEMGDGGEVPPPQKIAYVEPHVAFWNGCINLLKLNKKMLEENGLLTEKLQSRNSELIKMAAFLADISQKEISGKMISPKEFDSLSFLGGEVERLTLNIIESNESFISQVNTPEKYIAVAADIYTYNDKCLEETVGMGDEIYVIAQINGLLYLTRGGVFSQYEFTQPTSDRLTDEEWQKQLLDNKEPQTAVWMNAIKINVPRPKTAANFNLY